MPNSALIEALRLRQLATLLKPLDRGDADIQHLCSLLAGDQNDIRALCEVLEEAAPAFFVSGR